MHFNSEKLVICVNANDFAIEKSFNFTHLIPE